MMMNKNINETKSKIHLTFYQDHSFHIVQEDEMVFYLVFLMRFFFSTVRYNSKQFSNRA